MSRPVFPFRAVQVTFKMAINLSVLSPSPSWGSRSELVLQTILRQGIFISSFILVMDDLCSVNLETLEVFGILILAKLGLMLLWRHLWLKYVLTLKLYIFLFRFSYWWMNVRLVSLFGVWRQSIILWRFWSLLSQLFCGFSSDERVALSCAQCPDFSQVCLVNLSTDVNILCIKILISHVTENTNLLHSNTNQLIMFMGSNQCAL